MARPARPGGQIRDLLLRRRVAGSHGQDCRRARHPGRRAVLCVAVLIVLALVLLAWIVHLAGGGMLDLRLGHFRLDAGFA
jgi:hypothetical protein